MRSLIHRALVALVLLAAASCSACWAGAPPTGLRPAVPSTATPAPADVVLFGDSLARLGQVPILDLWHAQLPDTSISFNAEPGAEAADWMPWFDDVTAGQCVTYLVGSNDISKLTAQQAEWNALAAFNALANADRIVAFNLNTTSHDLRGAPFSSRARHYNGFLAQLYADGTYPNLHVLDWNAISLGRPELLTGDRLHLNADGLGVYADAITQAAEWC
jgi:hypothetical protein